METWLFCTKIVVFCLFFGGLFGGTNISTFLVFWGFPQVFPTVWFSYEISYLPPRIRRLAEGLLRAGDQGNGGSVPELGRLELKMSWFSCFAYLVCFLGDFTICFTISLSFSIF